MNHNELVELYKKLEALIVPIYEKYKDVLSEDDKKDYLEFMEQGEYELAISNLLGSLNNHTVVLDNQTDGVISEIYQLMKTDRPKFD